MLCVQKITKEADGTITLHLKGGDKLQGFNQVLMAIGRKPETSKLGLDVSILGALRTAY
jgi:pyruvate/2-oxoglutarate dehydrogenase complex dihydrolipoamide dehydrogenase (E3) component